MFDLSWTSWLGLTGGLSGIAIAAAAYFLGARAVVEALAPLLKFVVETAVAGLQAFGKGLQGLIDSLSDLITLAVVVFLTFAGTSLYYRGEIRDLKIIHAQEMVKKGKAPKQIQDSGFWPWEWR